MTTLATIKDQKQNKVNDLITSCNVFFAFNNDQFNEGRTKNPLSEGDKYVSISAGGYMPKSKVDNFINGMADINKWYKSALAVNRLRAKNILYELFNYEAFYTGDITDTLAALGGDYTRAEVLKVYRDNYKKCTANL